MSQFSKEQLNRISNLVREIEELSDIEKLYLYLQLPCGRIDGPEGKSKLNGRSHSDLLSKKPDQETTQTYTWILSHLEEDPNVSLPKQEVYDEYRAFCQVNNFEPLCVADFGKAMKHAFPCIKPRRLGQRGNSRYCYSGLRKKYKIQPPNLPDMLEPTFCIVHSCAHTYGRFTRDDSDGVAYAGHGVIDLKVDPDAQARYHSNGNGTGQPATDGYPMSHQPGKQPDTVPVVGPDPKRLDATHMHETCLQRDAYASSIGQVSQASQSRYGYSDDLMGHQPPGTPDDDDYRHNYLDITPMSSLCLGGPLMQASDHFSGQLHATTSSYMYQQKNEPNCTDDRIALTTTNSADTNNTDNTGSNSSTNMDMSTNNQQFGEHLNSLNTNQQAIQQQNNIPTSQNAHLSTFSNTQIDFCASPFQSPASTPYPTMGSYLSQDIQTDYYSNDCIRYSGQ